MTTNPTDADLYRGADITPQERLYAQAILARELPLTPARLFRLASGLADPTPDQERWLDSPAGAGDRRRLAELKGELDALTAVGGGPAGGSAGPTVPTVIGALAAGDRSAVVRRLDRYPVHLAAVRRAGLPDAVADDMLAALEVEAKGYPAGSRPSFADLFPRWAADFLRARGGEVDPPALAWPALLEYAVVIATLRDTEYDHLDWQRAFRERAEGQRVDTVKKLLAVDLPPGEYTHADYFDAFRSGLAEAVVQRVKQATGLDLMAVAA